MIDPTTTFFSFSKVDREARARIEYPNIEQLADSLYSQGFIHPIALNQAGILVAGGRRSAALDHLFANPEKYPAASADPDMRRLLEDGRLMKGVHFSLKITESEDHLRELELIENVQREQFTWQEECIAISRIHSIKRRDAVLNKDTWGQRETGRLLKTSAASINYAVRIASKLSDKDSPLWQASSITEALQMLTTEKFDEANRLLVTQAKNRASILPEIKLTKGSDFFATFTPSADEGDHVELRRAPYGPEGAVMTDDINGPETIAFPQSGLVSEPDLDDHIAAHQTAHHLATQLVYNMDCIDFFKHLGPASVDHVVCDPPYGIDMRNLSQTNTGQDNIDRIADTHDVQENEKAFAAWLKGCHYIMKESGFCVWWCDISQFERIKTLAVEAGFKAQSWQLTWHKTTNCLNQRAEYNFTKNTEIAIVLRKGDARLLSAQPSSVWSGGLTLEDKTKFAKHPFIKPAPLWKWLLDAVALPGSVVADPFSGVGSSTLEMFRLGYQPRCCEIDVDHYNQQIVNLTGLITDLSK